MLDKFRNNLVAGTEKDSSIDVIEDNNSSSGNENDPDTIDKIKDEENSNFIYSNNSSLKIKSKEELPKLRI